MLQKEAVSLALFTDVSMKLHNVEFQCILLCIVSLVIQEYWWALLMVPLNPKDTKET